MEIKQPLVRKVCDNMSRVIVGKDHVIHTVFATWMAGGHVLLEDVPGTGKTVLAKSLAKSVDIPFGRVQFTPDLLPSDLTGTSIYDEANKKFLFRKGPLFTTLFLGDEINRATPRAQSALLESMAEGQITAEGMTTPLPPLFFVIGTQNPLEHQGTFPLPEAALDRFTVCLSLGVPEKDQEVKMLLDRTSGDPLNAIGPVLSSKELLAIKEEIKKVEVKESLARYIQRLYQDLREHPALALGPSPRSGLQLLRLAMATSFFEGQSFVGPDVIYELAKSVLCHRIILTSEAKFEGIKKSDVVDEVLKKVKATLR